MKDFVRATNDQQNDETTLHVVKRKIDPSSHETEDVKSLDLEIASLYYNLH